MTSLSEEIRASTGGPVGCAVTMRDVTKVYRLGRDLTVAAVRRLNLEVAPGEFVVIVGRSGSGKTTLLNLASGMAAPTAGKVLVDGVDLGTLSDREQSRMRNGKIGFVFQFPSLLPSLTAVENVSLPTMFADREAKETAYDRAVGLLELVGLGDRLHALPRQLSAGQQKRVVIARALMNRPQLLLADEPTADLDEETEREFMVLLKEVHLEAGITVLLVTHNLQIVGYGTRTIKMANGEIVE